LEESIGVNICLIETEIHIGQQGMAMEFLQEAENGLVKIAEE
jgi:hypothetical protein